MLTNLFMKNFKAFEDENLELGSLNMLTGLNNSGKSSVIQALRLINVGKALPELGPLKEYIRGDLGESSIGCIQRSKNAEKNIQFTFNRASAVISSGNERMSGIVSYISADRFGPRNQLPINIDEDTQTVGNCGEYIVDFLSLLDGKLAGLRTPPPLALEGIGVMHNIQEWLRIISPDVELRYYLDQRASMGRTEFNGYRPVHVGFGLSYTLPVIASILIHSAQLLSGDTESALLMVENPEAHLHPSGQTMMGKILALAASCGLQVIVETHSDHLLNGVRLAVKDEKLPCDDVKIYFFEANDKFAPANVEQLKIDKYGMLDYWPDGFFDETEKNLMRLV